MKIKLKKKILKKYIFAVSHVMFCSQTGTTAIPLLVLSYILKRQQI